MRRSFPFPRRATAVLATLAACAALPGMAWAQGTATPPPRSAASASTATAAPPTGRPDQRIERIHVEDAGAKIDELRVGGETQRITVQPKSGLPAYEILPSDGKNSPPGLTREGAPRGNGERVWKVLSF